MGGGKPPKGHLTLSEWRTYRTAFEMAFSLLVKYSEREVEEKVLQGLSEAWHDRLAKHSAKRADEKHWVKVMRPCPLGKGELERMCCTLTGSRHLKV